MKTDRNMKTYRQNRWREGVIPKVISHKLSSSIFYHKLTLSKFSIMTLLPLLFSCQDILESPEETDDLECHTIMKVSGSHRGLAGSSLDIFTFDSSKAGLLDSYQRCEGFSGSELYLRSGSGEKNVFACSDGQRSRQEWSIVNSRESLDGLYADLRKERRAHLCMTGSASMDAGSGQVCDIRMRTLTSEIVLNSVSCDFSGRAYQDREISDVRVYLTNVNAQCRLTAEGEVMPVEIINAGGLDEEDLSQMAEPDMLVQEIPEGITEDVSEVGISLLCYPNASRKESPGTPFTRLVIEGKIDGETFWWPIDINREDGIEEPGIHRCRQYIYDVTITRKGSHDPDKTVETDAVRLQLNIKPWEEKDRYQVSF